MDTLTSWTLVLTLIGSHALIAHVWGQVQYRRGYDTGSRYARSESHYAGAGKVLSADGARMSVQGEWGDRYEDVPGAVNPHIEGRRPRR